MGSGARSQGLNVCLIPFVVAWHGVTSVSWCGLGWTPSRDSRSWQLGGIRGCSVDWILGRPKFSIYCTSSISMRSITPTSSQSVGISPVPQSLLQASPMNVEHALGVPIFTDFQIASECIRSHGPDSCCIMDVKGQVADRLSQENLPFHALEFVRSDHGIWAHEHNAASLPLGCLSSSTWIRRLQSVSIVRPVDAGNPWTWKGRTMSNSVLVRFLRCGRENRRWF